MNNFEITLSDGTILPDLKLNGNNFITGDQAIARRIKDFVEDHGGILRKVEISGDPEGDEAGLIGEHEYMRLVQCVKYAGNWWFVLQDLSEREIRDLELDARLDYLEMMTEE